MVIFIRYDIISNYVDSCFKRIKWRLCFCRSYEKDRNLWKIKNIDI